MNDAMDVNLVGAPPTAVPFETAHAAALGWAQRAASLSRDPSTQVGCALFTTHRDTGQLMLLAMGYNRFPPGMEYTAERLNNRPDKYMFTVHAERDALDAFLRNTLAGGPAVALNTVVAYIWGMSPCTECIKDLANAGIRTVYYHFGASDTAARARYAITDASQAIINEVGMRVIDLNHIAPLYITATAQSNSSAVA